VALTTLGEACAGVGEAFLSADLTSADSVEKSGYTVTMADGAGAADSNLDCNGTQSRTTYYATAEPLTVGSTGQRGFATNQGMTVWQDRTGALPAEPFTIGADVSPIQ
jgi:hypothetical protein